MSRCIEQEICKTSCMNTNKKIKFKDWYMKRDQPIWIEVEFEFMNILKDEPKQKALFINK